MTHIVPEQIRIDTDSFQSDSTHQRWFELFRHDRDSFEKLNGPRQLSNKIDFIETAFEKFFN